MNSSKLASRWAIENPAIARGRLLTAGRYLASAVAPISRMCGYLDAMSITEDGADLTGVQIQDAAKLAVQYLELGMDEVQRELLHAVHALDMGDAEAPGVGPFAPLHPASKPSATVTELARELLAAEVARLRAGGGGWGGGSPEAQRLCAAIEVLLDSTIVGRRR